MFERLFQNEKKQDMYNSTFTGKKNILNIYKDYLHIHTSNFSKQCLECKNILFPASHIQHSFHLELTLRISYLTGIQCSFFKLVLT